MKAQTGRRWTMPVRQPNGEPGHLVVHVPRGRGLVYASLGNAAIALEPQDVSRLRQRDADALAVALQDRGTW